MANSYVQYTGNGVVTNFSLTFPYLDVTHVGVAVDGVTTAFTWVNPTTIQISPAPANLSVVEIRRTTPNLVPIVDFQDGAILTEDQLDTNALQVLYVSQEGGDTADDAMGKLIGSTAWDAESEIISNVADPVANQDAVTKAYFTANTSAVVTAAAAAAVAAAAASASAASVSAAAALADKVLADAAAASAASSYDSFDDRYLGSKAVAPPLDNDGNALVTGALYYDSVLLAVRYYTGSTWDTIAPGLTQAAGDLRYLPLSPAIRGLQITSRTNTTITYSTGVCANDAYTAVLNVTGAAINCATVGANGLDAGSLANNTWYHTYAIGTTGSTRAFLASTSVSAPTMPGGYTLKRRIGSFKTNGSAQIIDIVQDGDDISFVDPSTATVNTTNPGTSAISATLNVPTGLRLKAKLIASLLSNDSGTVSAAYVSDLSTTDIAPTTGGTCNVGLVLNAAGGAAGQAAELQVKTNTSGQVRYRLSGSTANIVMRIYTLGWVDRRGQDA